MSPHAIPERTASRCAGRYAGAVDQHRLLQIFTESRKLALDSKVPDTARSRFDLAVEVYYQLISLELSDALRSSVHEEMATLAQGFPSQVSLNEALGLCSKAGKAKTTRQRLEYLNRARDVLGARLAEGIAGVGDVQAAYDRVIAEIRDVEALVSGAQSCGSR